MNTALITGASSGIGLELAKIHASKGGNLVLVARNYQKLLQLKNEIISRYTVDVFLIEKDLSETNSALEIVELINKNNIQIDILMNNAGFGDYGSFANSDWKKNQQMINLNIMTLTQLTHLLLPDMIGRKNGKILNVASVAAFQPGPLMAVYFASKAFVLHFSEALNNETQNYGVSVTALCPGPTASNFVEVAQMQNSSIIKNKKLPSPKEVAEYGYKALINKQSTAIHGLINYLLANSVRFFPRKLVVLITRYLLEKA